MADATSTFTVRGKADVDDAVRGLNRLGDEAKQAGDKADGMGGQFRTMVGSILTAELGMKALEIALEAARAAFDFARQATLEYMQSTNEGRAQIALFNSELGNLKEALGEAVTDSRAFRDGFEASLVAMREITAALPELIDRLDKYYLAAAKADENTGGLASGLYGFLQHLGQTTPFGIMVRALDSYAMASGGAEQAIRDAADAAAAATEPINGFGTAWLEATSSINTVDAALRAMNLTDFFFGVTEAATEAAPAVMSYAATVDMAAVASEKLKRAQEAAAQAMRDATEAMNQQDDEWATLLEGFNQIGEDEFARVQQRIAEEAAAAEAAAIEAKGKIAAALQPADGEGFGLGALLRKDYDAAQEAFGAIGGAAEGLGGALSSGLGAALSSQEKFGKAFKSALGQTLVSLGVSELLTGISNLIPFGPNFNPAAGAARLALGGTLLATGKAMGGKGESAGSGGGGGGGGGGGRSVGEASGLTPMAQPQRQGPTNLIDYTGVTIVTNDTDSMRTLIDRQSRTAATGGTSRV
jgi:hypothetical protein